MTATDELAEALAKRLYRLPAERRLYPDLDAATITSDLINHPGTQRLILDALVEAGAVQLRPSRATFDVYTGTTPAEQVRHHHEVHRYRYTAEYTDSTEESE